MILRRSLRSFEMTRSFCDIVRGALERQTGKSRVFSFLRTVELDWLQITRALLDARINDLSRTNRKGVNLRVN